jgi:hypothetical protein
MVEAAEEHAAPRDANACIEDDPLMELAIFNALDWSDMWDDAHCLVVLHAQAACCVWCVRLRQRWCCGCCLG